MRTLFPVLLFTVSLCAQTRPAPEVFKTNAGGLKILPIRHASLMIEAGGKVIHVDPWSQGNFDGLPKADIVLVTDIHGDHMDAKAIAQVSKAGTRIVTCKAVAEKVGEATVIANGESTSIGDFKFEAVPMYNEKRGPSEGKFFHDKGRGNGYVVSYGGLRVYIAGDTEGHAEMRALKNIDVALIPMNLPYTMTPEEAADAVKVFKPKVAIPYHYRESDTKIFADALKSTGIDVRLINWYY